MCTVDIYSQVIRSTSEDIHAQPNNVYELKRKKWIITCLHKADFIPVPSKNIDAIKAGLYTNWPGFTVELVSKHLYKSHITTKGHLKKNRQKIWSTKIPASTRNPQQTAMTTSSTKNNIWSNHSVSMKITEFTGKVTSYQTGAFPIIYRKRNKYVMVLHDNDTNVILAEPLKSRAQ